MNRKRYQFRFAERVTSIPPSSSIDLRRQQNRLFVDEVYGEAPETRVTVNGISIRGRWDIETEDVGEFDYILRLVERQTSNSISLTFTDQEARLRAVESLESDRELEHVHSSPKSVQLESILEQKEGPRKPLLLKVREWGGLRWILGRPELATAED
jgi:hypothetical protein